MKRYSTVHSVPSRWPDQPNSELPAPSPRQNVALVMVLAVCMMIPGTVMAKNYGDDCGPLEFKCWYDAAVAWYEEVVIPEFERQISSLKGQLGRPKEIADNLARTITDADLGALGLDTEAMDRYVEALEFIEGQNDKFRDEFEYFAIHPDCEDSRVCNDFRTRLADLFYTMTEISNQANKVVALQTELEDQPPPPPLLLNSEGVADFIAQAPPMLLFPLYYMMNASEPDSGQATQQLFVLQKAGSTGCTEAYCKFFDSLEGMLAGTLNDLISLDDHLEYVKNHKLAGTLNDPISLDDHLEYVKNDKKKFGLSRDPLCTAMFLDAKVPDEISKYASALSVTAKIVAEFGGWWAKPKLSLVPEGIVQGFSFGVETGVHYDIRLGSRFGIHLRRLATPLNLIGAGVSARVSDCRQRLEQYLVICSLANDVKKNDTFQECKVSVLFTEEKFGF